MRSVGILGLGLIGGSLARDLAADGWRVVANDTDAAALAAARAAGVVVGPLTPAEVGSLDLLILAVPVRTAPALIREIARALPPRADVAVTDVGSTKRSVSAAAQDDPTLARRFVGSHPMAGSHRSGWSAGRTGLFAGRTVWICPGLKSDESAVAAVEELWHGVGARPERIADDDHDRIIARISHLPQAAATALANLLAAHDVDPRRLGPGGRDTTRLAGSDPRMWTDILLDNADHTAPLLDELAHELSTLAALIRTHDAPALRSRFATARTWTTPPDPRERG